MAVAACGPIGQDAALPTLNAALTAHEYPDILFAWRLSAAIGRSILDKSVNELKELH